MLPAPIEHRFVIDGEPYVLVEWDRGQERRIRLDYAMAIAAAPTVIEPLDGNNLYAEAIARECLKEAPAIFWDLRPPAPGTNGTPVRVVSLEHVPRGLWEEFRKELDAFLARIFPAVSPEPGPATPAGPDEPPAMALAQTVPAVLRGRAE
jgi:hypothetical protein